MTSELLTRGQRANIDARAKRMATEFQARAVDYLTWRTSFECYIPSYGMVDGLVSKMLANATLDEALAYEELKAARLAREDVRRIYERLREFMAGDVG